MGKEKILSLVEARANLSDVVDQANKRGQTYVIAKRGKPVGVVLGYRKYQEMANGRKHLKRHGDKRIFKLSNTATSDANIDQAIKDLRKSRIAYVASSISK